MNKDLPAGSRAVHEAMMKHMDMMNGMRMTGDTDKDFAMMRIHHHQQAIDMSRAQVKHGKDPELRRRAEEIKGQREGHRRSEERGRIGQ